MKRKLQILAVDDEPDFLRLLEKIIINKTNFGITTVQNSLEIPHILEEKEFDLIITDLFMPGLSGMEILELACSGKRKENVLIITAYPESEFLQKVRENCPESILIKPVKTNDLIDKINDILNKNTNE